jgi:cell division protein FtsA
MIDEFITGIDIGTSDIKILITEKPTQNEKPLILHAISSPSHGFRHGYVTDADLALKSLHNAIKKIEKKSRKKIQSAKFSISGIGLSSQLVRTKISISRKNSEITQSDIDDVLEKSERLFSEKYQNKKILHIIPIKYSVEGRDVLGSPVGIYGSELEAKIIFVTILEHHYDAFEHLIKNLNINIEDIMAGPIADAKNAAMYQQKSQGCIVANIGSETTSFITFENGNITSLKIEKIGSNDITNDLALGLQTSLHEAENIKKMKNQNFPKRKVEEIIYARISDILELAERHLQSIKKNRLLPAGIIFSGGGSRIEFLEEYAKKYLHLPAEKAMVSKYNKKTKRNTDLGPEFSTAYGLCYGNEEYQLSRKKIFNLKNIKKVIINIFNQIMP